VTAPRDVDELSAHVGREVGASAWREVTQDAVERRPGGARVTTTLTFEREGADRPVCVAELLIHLGL
jgi:hypothetical protein